jgi:hypothetical protein
METPSAAAINEWSDLNFAEYGYGEEARLDRVIGVAVSFIELVTGQTLTALDPTLDPLMQDATMYATEDRVLAGQPDISETVADFNLISSFSAGPYSETRRSLTEMAEARMIVADPRLNALLWGLMTPDKRDEWNAWVESGGSGENVYEPAYEVVETDWRMPTYRPVPDYYMPWQSWL